jgi:anti-sigma factor RsiW
LQALAFFREHGRSADDALAHALQRLRAIDDKSYLAYALNRAADVDLRIKENEQARGRAAEALAVASIMQRSNEIAIARALLAQSGEEASMALVKAFASASSDRDRLSARARSLVQAAQLFVAGSNGHSHGLTARSKPHSHRR